MTKYRILEKEGTYTGPLTKLANVFEKDRPQYIPRFIVQKEIKEKIETVFRMGDYTIEYGDLEEFSSLVEARGYKRSLELKEGIVRE